jgi:MoxR-like ATPase
VTDAAEVLAVAEEAKAVYVEESLNRYVVALVGHTRTDTRLYLGASPRAGVALLRVAKAHALSEGREFLRPEDVKAVAGPVLAHRLLLAPEARTAGVEAGAVVRDALEHTPVPV